MVKKNVSFQPLVGDIIIENVPHQYLIGGIIGAFISALCVIVLINLDIRFFYANGQRTCIRIFLLIFAVCHTCYYLGIAISKEDPPQEPFYSCHLVALFCLYIAFVCLCTMWVEEIGASPKTKMCARISRNIWITVYTSFKVMYMIEHLMFHEGYWGLMYRIFFFGVAISLMLLSIVYVIIVIRLRLNVRRCVSANNVANKLTAVIVVSFLCYFLRFSFVIFDFVMEKYYPQSQFLSPIIWYISAQLIPDTGLFAVIFYLTRVQQEKYWEITATSRWITQGDFTDDEILSQEFIDGVDRYERPFLSGTSSDYINSSGLSDF